MAYPGYCLVRVHPYPFFLVLKFKLRQLEELSRGAGRGEEGTGGGVSCYATSFQVNSSCCKSLTKDVYHLHGILLVSASYVYQS